MILSEHAWAKLNLSLDILGLRPDGYHELEMVMQTVSLCDEVNLTLSPSGPWSICGSGLPMPLDETNLAWRAAEAYFAGTGLHPGLEIRVEKRIPSQAGLGGGSADAAAVLRALQRHYGLYSQEKLETLALSLGSDVPFCLLGGCRLARGRGEQLSELPALPDCGILIVKPACAISTGCLYRATDAEQKLPHPDTAALTKALGKGDLPAAGKLLCNSFEPLACRLYPEVEQLLAALKQTRCLGAAMTGSGSACFAIYEDAQAAREALEALSDPNWLCFVANSVS